MNSSEKKMYTWAKSEYMYESPQMGTFEGTYREMLLNLITGEDQEEFIHLTNEELLNLINESNGDGQPYIMVYDTVTQKKVIG